jgi:hypothetical protein
MKYLALVYLDEKAMAAMPEADWAALNRECIACGDSLRASGHMLDGAPLEPTTTATTLRIRNGKLSVTDGPFAETREQLAGFYMLEARDLNEAIQAAGKIPPARYGSIEVRPVRSLDPFRI